MFWGDQPQQMSLYSAGWVVLVAGYSACELAWHIWEHPVGGVVYSYTAGSVVPVVPYSACELARHRWEQPVVGGVFYSAGWLVPMARDSACELAWHRWKQPVGAVGEVVPVAAIVHVLQLEHNGTKEGHSAKRKLSLFRMH